jgi:ATP-dependent DNA helicase RecG
LFGICCYSEGLTKWSLQSKIQSMDIIDLLKNEESKTLEFKRDLTAKEGILRTIIAFANTAGGTLLIGIEDKTKHVVGVSEPLDYEEKLANLISDCIEPQLLPEIQVVPWRNTYLLTIQIFPSSTKPHYLRKHGMEKGTFIRVGSSNRQVDKVMLSELQRVKFDDSFDKQPMTTLSSEDLDFRVASELFSPTNLTLKNLETLDCLTTYQQHKVPTVGGFILFGKDRLKHFPDAWIQAGRFAGTNKTNIIDTQEILSTPIAAIDEAIGFFKKHAMRRIEIPGATGKSRNQTAEKNVSLSRHMEVWDIPLTAIREAIINAVVHADYAQQGSPIRIAMFDDRIEIENPGLLLFGLTIEEIKSGISKLRNRVIGQVFHRLGLIERWGSGIRKIIDFCVQAGFAEPKFEEIGTHFKVTIFTQQFSLPKINESDQVILNILKNANGLSTKEIASYVRVSERTVRNRLISLIKRGLVVEIATGPTDPKRKYYFRPL